LPLPPGPALSREVEHERARDRAVAAAWARLERSCATAGGFPPPRLRSDAEHVAAAAERLRRLDAWARTPEGRIRTALAELAAALADAQILYEQARAAADRSPSTEADCIADRAHRLDEPLARARRSALELWLAADATGHAPFR
jgi:hypothetical protein